MTNTDQKDWFGANYMQDRGPRDEARDSDFNSEVLTLAPEVVRVTRQLDTMSRELARAKTALRESVDRLETNRIGSIMALAMVTAARDPYTAHHQRRVANLCDAIGQVMEITPQQLELVRDAGLLHDIGKIAVPAEILSKPGHLGKAEVTLIEHHSQVGHDIVNQIESLRPLAKIVLQHHERLNGLGYPLGISGADILLEAHIVAVADVVEAMTSHRPYRAALGINVALKEISASTGVLYDRDVVNACVKLFTEMDFDFERERDRVLPAPARLLGSA